MIGSEFLATIYGLGSALVWGAGDFSGGLATKKGNILGVIAYSQIIGLILLLILALFIPESPLDFFSTIMGGIAGIFGVLGLVGLYSALANGRMSIVAPLSAVITAIIPIIYSFYFEGLPKTNQLIGIIIAILSVWYLSAGKNIGSRIQKKELVLSALAGVGFGLFFICIDQVADTAIIRPLVAARVASSTLFILILLSRKQISVPKPGQPFFILLAGVFDASGNALFALAASLGRLDIASVLSSLYPISTVLLAWFILKERLQLRQWFGVIAAIAALILIAY